MIRSTLQDIYPAIDNLSAANNQIFLPMHTSSDIWLRKKKINTQQNLSSTLYDKLEP